MKLTCTANWAAANLAQFNSIAVQALTQPQGGISASIGSSTYMNSDHAVAFMSQLIKNADSSGTGTAGGIRWGTALMKTQQWAASKGPGFYADFNKTEQIFGDPAMPVFSKTKPAGSNPYVRWMKSAYFGSSSFLPSESRAFHCSSALKL